MRKVWNDSFRLMLTLLDGEPVQLEAGLDGELVQRVARPKVLEMSQRMSFAERHCWLECRCAKFGLPIALLMKTAPVAPPKPAAGALYLSATSVGGPPFSAALGRGRAMQRLSPQEFLFEPIAVARHGPSADSRGP
jgi:hypothetical protein